MFCGIMEFQSAPKHKHMLYA